MIKEREDFLRKFIMLADGAFIAFAYGVTCCIDRFAFMASYTVEQYSGPALLIILIWINAFIYLGLYKSLRTRKLLDVVGRIVKGGLFVGLVIVAAATLFRIPYFERNFLVTFLAMAMALLIMEKSAIMILSRYIRRRGYNYRRIMVVGTGPRAEKVVTMIKRHAEWGLKIEKIIDRDSGRLGTEVGGVKVTGLLKDMVSILHEEVIDEVIFVVPRSWLDEIEASIIQCELEGVRTYVAMDLYDLKIAKGSFTYLNGFPLVSFNTVLIRQEELFMKRVFDIVFSALILLVACPLFAAIAVAIKLTSPGPVLFRQTRVGLKGRTFTMLKFRSMVVGAEEAKDRLEALNEMKGPVFKIKKDPRLTPVGRLLRKTSMDELPQFINVLTGEMSVIGPRPPIPSEVEQYEDWQRRRLSLKPGITCLWQIGGRSTLDFDEWMKLDLEYIDNWSLWLDLKILLKTIPAVMSGRGAL